MLKIKDCGLFFSSSGASRAQCAARAADEIGDLAASALVRIVARAHEVTVAELFHHSRSCAPIAASRQLAMYLMHVVLGRNFTQVGRFFGRDRTTVSYACRVIEDMRDDGEFEKQVADLEVRIEQVISASWRLSRFLALEADYE